MALTLRNTTRLKHAAPREPEEPNPLECWEAASSHRAVTAQPQTLRGFVTPGRCEDLAGIVVRDLGGFPVRDIVRVGTRAAEFPCLYHLAGAVFDFNKRPLGYEARLDLRGAPIPPTQPVQQSHVRPRSLSVG